MRWPVAIAAVLLLAAVSFSARATTWDEPWQEAIVKDADTFVRVTVTKADAKGFTAKVTKHLAGERPAGDVVTVDRYTLLRIRSMTIGAGHDETRFKFAVDEDCYLFLKRPGKAGENWGIATPTSGYAGVDDKGNVIATYRHSYHMALVPIDLYESSMTAIYRHLHGERVDPAYAPALFKRYLTQAPAAVTAKDAAARALFFAQHVALEVFYHLGTAADVALLDLFVKSDDYHARISAVRALSRVDTPRTRERLFEAVSAKGNGFASVMAVWGLRRLDAREYLPRLRELARTAPEEETGFGGNIMDPRVGTGFPNSVRAACEHLVAEWTAAPAAATSKPTTTKPAAP